MRFDMKEYFNLYKEAKTEDEKVMIEKMAAYDLITMINNPEDYEVMTMADPEKKAKQLINDLIRITKCPVYFMDDPYKENCQGYYNFNHDFIRVSDDLHIEDKARVMVHELSHSLEKEAEYKNSSLGEIKADATSLLVCNFYRIDTCYGNVNYIKKYIERLKKEHFIDENFNELKEIMAALHHAFTMAIDMIDQIENQLHRGLDCEYNFKKHIVDLDRCEKAYFNATINLFNHLHFDMDINDEISMIGDKTINKVDTGKDSMSHIEMMDFKIKLFEKEQEKGTIKQENMRYELTKVKERLEEIKNEYQIYLDLPDSLKLIILKNVKTKLKFLSVLNKLKENKDENELSPTPQPLRKSYKFKLSHILCSIWDRSRKPH